MPNFKLPLNSQDPLQVYQEIKYELMLDGNLKQNLATFCQTQVDDFIHRLYELLYLNKNMIDKDEYQQTAKIESSSV